MKYTDIATMKKEAEITYLPEHMKKYMTPQELQLMSDVEYNVRAAGKPTFSRALGFVATAPVRLAALPATMLAAALTPAWGDKELKSVAANPDVFVDSYAWRPISGPYTAMKLGAAYNALKSRAYERAKQQKKAADNLYRAEFPGPDGLLVTPPKGSGPLNHDAMQHIHKVMQLVRSLPKTRRDNVATFTYGKGGIGNLATSFDQSVQDKYDANAKDPQI